VSASDRLDDFAATGRFWWRGAVTGDDLERLRGLYAAPARPGARVEAQDDLFRAVTQAQASQRIAELWPGMRPVRLVAFDKTPEMNWALPWHQDRVIAVRERVEAPGCSAWSLKGETWHCEPPVEVLAPMLFVRIHLDDCDEDNGAMEIAPGTHRRGVIPAEATAERAERAPCEVTTAQAGDVLILAMLTLHRSRPSLSPKRRRVLRVDYAAGDPPPPLVWAI
jgi:ectoine hydroxylase-related dioxygenase (phytanoyl-CoA dioxygenase family)